MAVYNTSALIVLVAALIHFSSKLRSIKRYLMARRELVMAVAMALGLIALITSHVFLAPK